VGDIFLVKYNAFGTVLWARNEGGTNDDIGYSVVSDASGNIYMTGYFSYDTITVGPYTLPNAGSIDMLVVKYDSGGNVLWAKKGGGTSDDRSSSVAVDASGNVFVTGNFSSPVISFDSLTLTNSGVVDMFIVKYDENGNAIWANNAVGTYSDQGNSVASEASGNTIVTGLFNSPSITFGTYTLTNSGNDDIFLVRYDSDGNAIWAEAIGGAQPDYGFSITMNSSGDAVVTGSFSSPEITFGSDTLLNPGNFPVFIAKAKWIYTGIDEAEISSKISVYPNPATEIITIKVPEGNTKVRIKIENIDGVEIMQKEIFESKVTMGIGDLPRGLYFIRIMSENGMQVAKFIKQ
ncbi:MAG: T9SS type A sorting domain-containing protein, partial [Bacteroidota bacterium]|nr:T9SS type A sorting domain-containing protein [Bacteroidota bacterium]